MRFTVNAAARPGTYEISSPDLPDWKLVAGNSAQLGEHITTGLRVQTRRAAVGAKLTPATEIASRPTIRPGDDTELAQLPLSALFADPTYQRPLDLKRIETMAANYDPELIGVLEVSARPDDRYALIDGQHRWALLRDLADEGTDPTVPCHIHRGLSVDDEAGLFYDIDAGRRRLTGRDRWVSRRGAGDPVVRDIEGLLAKHNLVTGDATRNGVVRSTLACEQIVSLGGLPLLDRTLDVVLRAFGDDYEALTAAILDGVSEVIGVYPEVDHDHLVRALGHLAARQWAARARARRETTKGTLRRLMAIVIVEKYNSTVPGPPVKLVSYTSRVPEASKTKLAPDDALRLCAVCEAPLRQPHTGRWPTYCPKCRDQRRRRNHGAAA